MLPWYLNCTMPVIHSIVALHKQIAQRADAASIRVSILAMLRDSIDARKNTLQEKESEHFTNAITALRMNMHATIQPSYLWLRLCLVDLEKAIASTILHDGDQPAAESSAGDTQYAKLMNAVAALERELSDTLS